MRFCKPQVIGSSPIGGCSFSAPENTFFSCLASGCDPLESSCLSPPAPTGVASNLPIFGKQGGKTDAGHDVAMAREPAFKLFICQQSVAARDEQASGLIVVLIAVAIGVALDGKGDVVG